ncbi:LacI family DNA-binding transcriptional regulator [Cohnella sp. GCM10020058]|uniref:LacI family DNA-binding transcriptional regulator n=1 Tax=Cohnella sp. GCM10020058 TaxID=3317330 RepID=UPI00363365C3
MATLKDIADQVGVSISTVSRVVNNDTSRSVNADTRQRIWDAVAQLGYNPGKTAKDGAGSKRGISARQPDIGKVGCIVAVNQNKYNHPYFSPILEGIERGIQEHGGELAYIHNGEDLKSPEMLQKVIQDGGVDGIIVVESIDPVVYDAIKRHIPCVVGIDVSDPSIPSVGYDRLMAAKHAVQHLISRGHRHIGFLGGSGRSLDITKEKRYRGYKEAMDEAGLAIHKEWILDTEWNAEKSYTLMKRALEKPAKLPSAFLAASDMMAISAMRAVFESGLRIPQDVAIASIDNIDFAEYATPPLTSVHIPKFEIGWVAAKTLVDVRQNKYPLPVKITLPFELMARQST